MAEPEKKVSVSKLDPNASISIELVDKRHIVIRRWSQLVGMECVNIHYGKPDEASSYLTTTIEYAKKVGAEIIEESYNAYRFIGLAGKLIIKDATYGVRVL